MCKLFVFYIFRVFVCFFGCSVCKYNMSVYILLSVHNKKLYILYNTVFTYAVYACVLCVQKVHTVCAVYNVCTVRETLTAGNKLLVCLNMLGQTN